ncbi:PadR family transcriptional regulator [Sinanaerobacter sp. ZZT-01]|uniref:PadR family transcriptional regulator n=1 Tax=Sinanaerobacter sp. ZZT-01 TaxID=3111540 RepID=UPI002D7788C8|nr:PadR family transcriptional regulator [Sinanaerobacter sp. ZZT-01]WRR93686.1 PadR family transcriptional regulator [Sinanaerobacter sp. ZZT-01]
MDNFEWVAQLRRGIMEFCVLLLINQKACYGYELVLSLEQFDYLSITEGTLYPLLRRLQKEKKLESYWLESKGGHPRKYYKLTALGLDVLNKMSSTWIELSKELNTLLVQREEN